jgi:hypothetical protein
MGKSTNPSTSAGLPRRGMKGASRPASSFHAIRPRQATTRGRAIDNSARRCSRHLATSSAVGSRLRPRASRGLHRTRLVMKTRSIPERSIIRRNNCPERSPLNGIPVRSPPSRPGAIPTNTTSAGTTPSPGTTRDRHRTNASQRLQSCIEARNRRSAISSRYWAGVGDAATNHRTCGQPRDQGNPFPLMSRPKSR